MVSDERQPAGVRPSGWKKGGIMAIGDIWRISVEAKQLGSVYANVLHFRANTSDPVEDLLQDIEANVLPVYADACVDSLQFSRIRAVQLTPTYGTWAQLLVSGVVGTIASEGNISQAAAVLRLRTNNIDRKQQGRVLLYGSPAAAIEDGVFNAGQMALYNLLSGMLMTQYVMGTPPWRLGVFSRVNGGTVPPFNEAGFTPTTFLEVNNNPATVRRRRLGRGQ
jgi:hypothetical protein